MSIVEKSIKSTIKATFVKEVLAGYTESGHDPDSLLESLGFKPLSELENHLLSVADFHKLSVGISETLKDEMLGFTASPMPVGSMKFLNQTLTQLQALDAALMALNNFHGLFNENNPVFSIEKNDNKLFLKLILHSQIQATSPYYMQRMLLGTYKQLCWLAKTKLRLNKVSLACPITNALSELQYVFGSLDIIESDQCYIEFSEDISPKPIVQSPEGASVFSEKSNFYTLLWPNLDALDLKIRLLISPHISTGFPCLTTLSDQLDISPQTLSRWLSEHSTNYQTIKDDLRRDVAVALLKNSPLSVKEIAFKVGYQESSAFSKAFKHWLGVSPTAYRQR